MNRRNFLKSFGAVGLVPLLPGSIFATAPSTAAAAASAVPSASYMWAETIVRAHNQCSLGLLQRHLELDFEAAVSVQTELIKNGVVNVHANEFGIRTATKPLFEGAFVKNSNPPMSGSDSATEFVEKAHIADDRDELSEEAEDSVELTHGFDEADVKMVTCEDVLAIMEGEPDTLLRLKRNVRWMIQLRKAIWMVLLVAAFAGVSQAKTLGPATVASPTVDRQDELDRIFNLLSNAKNPTAGALIADQMWLVFMSAPDEQTAEDMNRVLRARGGYNFDKALGVLNGMIERHPTYAESWNQRSFIHFLKKDHDKSLADCRRALELEPRHIGCMSGMARILIRHQQRFVEGEKLLRRAMELHPHIHEKVLLKEIPKTDL